MTLHQNFVVNKITLRDAKSNQMTWSTEDPPDNIEVQLPKGFHGSGDLLLEIHFSVEKEVQNFNAKFKFLFKNNCLEEWPLEFGTVAAKTSHTWTIELETSPLIDNMPFDVISGHITIDVKLCENDSVFKTMKMRVFYLDH